MRGFSGGRHHRLALLCLLLIAVIAAVSTANATNPSPGDPSNPVVVRLSLHDTIQPITADYLRRGLDSAARLHAQAVLISLGTPGGLLSSTRDIVADIEQSPVPVIVYIAPAGSRAGSAGFFILESADIAAMARGTNAGAAHPIVEGKTMDPVLRDKIENDAAAFLRSYAERRGRNVAAAEDAVRNSKSYSEQESLKLNLIDLTAPNESALLATLDNRQIKRFDGETQTLHLHNPRILNTLPSTRERLLSRLTDPNLAVLLLTLGGLLIYLEFNVPGTIVPGALGTFLMLLGAFGLNLLPIRHTALLLLASAVILILLEIKFTSHGALGLAGIAALVFGLATLVDSPQAEFQVRPATAIALGISFGTISFFLTAIALSARRNKVLTGSAAMIGKRAMVRAITPALTTVQVELRGELWQARSATSPLTLGQSVLVRAVEGLILIVEPANPPASVRAD